MINTDVLVKYVIKVFYGGDNYSPWPEAVQYLRWELDRIKRGFPGVSDSDLSLVTEVKPGERYIFDDSLQGGNPRNAPIMGVVLDPGRIKITGIGEGLDDERDPARILLRPGYTVQWDVLWYKVLIRVDTVPKKSGGSMYYFYNKSPLDQRW